MYYPVDTSARITSNFGLREAPKAGASTDHKGIDIAVPVNTAVKAAVSGIIENIGYNSQAGNYIELTDTENGIKTVYKHLNNAIVNVGDIISQGDTIAYSGNTGNTTGAHLHFETILNGQYVDPLSFFNLEAGAAAPGSSGGASGSASGINNFLSYVNDNWLLIGGMILAAGLLLSRRK